MDIRHPGQVFGLERRRGACGYATVSQVWWILSPCGRREGNEIAALFWKCFRCFDRLATVFVFVFRHPYMLWQFVHLKVSDTSLQDSPFCIYLCMCVCVVGCSLDWIGSPTLANGSERNTSRTLVTSRCEEMDWELTMLATDGSTLDDAPWQQPIESDGGVQAP